ncbi:MAG TPA: 30S ribosomal protein S11 [Candidatus Paceibacterota bacterium]|nr:30S ribosomal protein S11 [Candidatus Paceibacterota bacterium]
MGKKRIITKQGDAPTEGAAAKVVATKKRMTAAILHIDASFNNTRVTLTDKEGNTVFSSSSGSLGFRGTKKGTPFAASKVGDAVGERAKAIGVLAADVFVRGVGSGREPAIRGFMTHGIEITSIKDRTPVPHNGPKAPKPRRI